MVNLHLPYLNPLAGANQRNNLSRLDAPLRLPLQQLQHVDEGPAPGRQRALLAFPGLLCSSLAVHSSGLVPSLRGELAARPQRLVRPLVTISASAAAMANLEAGWERFRSDIRGFREIIDANQQKPILQFHIPVRPRGPRYRPGSGPPPPVINLRPVHDSDAFIVDKVVLPRGRLRPNSDLRQRRCYYIIGWPDLHAARPAVDASKILDYVSPRTLEDWEYQDALRREEEREKEKEAEKLAVATGKSVATPGAGNGTQPGARRRPGRPPRASMTVAEPTPEPELNSEQEELVHKRMRGPSLSTPQKSRLAQLVAEEEMLEESEGVDENTGAPTQRQLEVRGEGISGGDVHMGVAEDSDLLRLSPAVPGRSSGQSSRASSTRPAPPNPPSSLVRIAAGTAAHGAAAPALARRARDRRSTSPSRSPHGLPRPPISTTPIPLPSHYSRVTSQRLPKSQAKSAPTATDLQPHVREGHSSALIPPQADQKQRHRSSSANSPGHTNGFTPIGGTFPRPPKRPAEASPISGDVSVNTTLKKSSKKKQVKLTEAASELPAEAASSPNPASDLVQGEQDYVVKCLEGDYILDGVHWFKVRWEGDWPEDENPTWEPRENITEKLVKDYLQRKAKRSTARPFRPNPKKKSKTKQTNLLADWAKGYGSVAEAFDGQAELNVTSDAMLDRGDGRDLHADTDDGPDEILVIDDQESQMAAEARKKAMEAQIAAQFASMARAAPRHF